MKFFLLFPDLKQVSKVNGCVNNTFNIFKVPLLEAKSFSKLLIVRCYVLVFSYYWSVKQDILQLHVPDNLCALAGTDVFVSRVCG